MTGPVGGGSPGPIGPLGATGPTGATGTAAAINYGTPADRSTVTTVVAIGANRTLTPAISGRVLLLAAGIAYNTTIGSATIVSAGYGTGTPPSAGSTPSYTLAGAGQNFISSSAAGQQGFSVIGLVTGLSLGISYWFDVFIQTSGGTTGGVKNVQLLVMEL
jgi:hypothetical protein